MPPLVALAEGENAHAARVQPQLVGEEVDHRVRLVGERGERVLELVDTQETQHAQHRVRTSLAVCGGLLYEHGQTGVRVTKAYELEEAAGQLADGVRLVSAESGRFAVHLRAS